MKKMVIFKNDQIGKGSPEGGFFLLVIYLLLI